MGVTTTLDPTTQSCPLANDAVIAGVSVAITAIITSIITAIVSSIITYWCCVKRISSLQAVNKTVHAHETITNVAYGVSGGKTSSTAVYETVN